MNERSEYRKFVVPVEYRDKIDPNYETDSFIIRKRYCADGWVDFMTITEFNQRDEILQHSVWYRQFEEDEFVLYGPTGHFPPMEVLNMDPLEQWEGGEGYELEWEEE